MPIPEIQQKVEKKFFVFKINAFELEISEIN